MIAACRSLTRNTHHKPVDGSPACAYPKKVAKKEATGFGDLKLTKADDRHLAAFFRPSHCISYERQWWGYLRVCRFALSPVRQPHHLLLTPFGDGLRGSQTDKETIMVNSTLTPEQIRLDTIKHLRWQAKAVANLLSAVHLLPAADQQTTLETTMSLADELTGDLAALVRGAQ